MVDMALPGAFGTKLFRSERDEETFYFLRDYIMELRDMMREAVEESREPMDEFVALCIEQCERWDILIDELASEVDERSNDVDEEDQIILAIAHLEEVTDYLVETNRGQTRALKTPPQNGSARLLALAANGEIMILDILIDGPGVQ